MGKKRNKHSKNKVSAANNLHHEIVLDIKNNTESLDSNGVDSDIKVNTCTLNHGPNIPTINAKPETDPKNELSFETYHPNSERILCRKYYVHSLCQICKEELTERVVCPKCFLITYCSHEHRRKHWPIHADLCGAIVDVCKERRIDHIMHGALKSSAEKFRNYRFQNMTECEIKVERPLEKWEKEMFIFPNVCGTCHEYDIQNLVICNSCRHSGFCKGHLTKVHDEWCKHVLKFKNIVREQSKYGIVYPTIPNCKMLSSLPKLSNIEHVFKNVSSDMDKLEFLELTEITTYPLTVLNALLTVNKGKLSKLNQITLHVVGAEADFEISKLEKWEYYILHLIPELQNLEIKFVGPELITPNRPGSYKECCRCIAAKKSVSFEFHNKLYHTFTDSSNFTKPNLICVFNPGLYRATGFNHEDTWSPTITSMFANNCPVLSTAYTHKEILLDVERVKSTENVCLETEPTPNPFSSLKPSLNFVSDEDTPVIFKNHFYSIMCKT